MPRPAHRVLVLAACAAISAPGCFASRRVHPRSAEELQRGYAYLAGGEIERAGIAFAHALEFDPDLVEAENGLGIAARTRGDLPGAVQRFRRALAIDAGFAEGHANLGEALLAGSDLDGAERSLRAAIALNPDLVEARHNLGRALLRAGLADAPGREDRWRASRVALLHVLESDGGRASAHADLALLDFLSGRVERAESSWALAARIAPSDPEAAHGLCLARTARGRCREAIPECERCLRLSPAHPRCGPALWAATACATR